MNISLDNASASRYSTILNANVTSEEANGSNNQEVKRECNVAECQNCLKSNSENAKEIEEETMPSASASPTNIRQQETNSRADNMVLECVKSVETFSPQVYEPNETWSSHPNQSSSSISECKMLAQIQETSSVGDCEKSLTINLDSYDKKSRSMNIVSLVETTMASKVGTFPLPSSPTFSSPSSPVTNLPHVASEPIFGISLRQHDSKTKNVKKFNKHHSLADNDLESDPSAAETISASLMPRRVSFPKSDHELVTGYLEPANPWEYGKCILRTNIYISNFFSPFVF